MHIFRLKPDVLTSVVSAVLEVFVGADLELRKQQKRVEMMWQASQSLPELRVFAGLTGEYGGNYGPPNGLCFEGDSGCDDSITWFNDPLKFGELVVAAEAMADKTQGRNIMFTMGSDFKYENADRWFTSMDALIGLSKADGRLNMFYSNPEMYADSKAAEVSSPLSDSLYLTPRCLFPLTYSSLPYSPLSLYLTPLYPSILLPSILFPSIPLSYSPL